MKKIKMQVELEYDTNIMYGERDQEAKDWFFNGILKGNDLTLMSGELGDEVGKIKVLSIEEGTEVWEKYFLCDWIKCAPPSIELIERRSDRDRNGLEYYYGGAGIWYRCRGAE